MAAPEPITINVTPEAARAYNASPEEREQLDFLLSLRLLAATHKLPPLLDLMDDISRKAKERGLTPEILEEILRDSADRRQALTELTRLSEEFGLYDE